MFQMALGQHQVALLQEHRQKLMDQKRQQLQADFQKALKEKQQVGLQLSITFFCSRLFTDLCLVYM